MDMLSAIKMLPARAFQTQGDPDKVSDRYQSIDTSQYLTVMYDNGFELENVVYPKTKKEGNDLFKKHIMVFQHSKPYEIEVNDKVKPRILITNSHDGTTAFRLQSGLLRLVCENGLVMMTNQNAMRIKHKGFDADLLNEKVIEMVQGFDGVYRQMGEMQHTLVSKEQRERIAIRGAKIALNGNMYAENVDDVDFEDYIDVNSILRAAYQIDRANMNTVYGVYNIVERNLRLGQYQSAFNIKARFEQAKPLNQMKEIEFGGQFHNLVTEYL